MKLLIITGDKETGKSTIARQLKEYHNAVYISQSQLNSTFLPFNPETKVLIVDDVTDFEAVRSLTTDSIVVDRPCKESFEVELDLLILII